MIHIDKTTKQHNMSFFDHFLNSLTKTEMLFFPAVMMLMLVSVFW